jgi:hypothetical protein
MFKRFQQHLKGHSGESASSDESDERSESVEDQPMDEEEAEESEDEEPLELVTEEDLQNADKEKEPENSDMSYQCSLCPHKILTSLADVKAHIVSKVCHGRTTK